MLALLDLLSPPGRPGAGFTILGDPAQAIYGFAATGTGREFPTPAEYWKKVTDAYGAELEIVELTHNYRAERPLADLSSTLRGVLLSRRTDHEKLRIVRNVVAALSSPAEPAGPSWLDSGDSGSRAILTRTNGESLRVLARLFGTEVRGGATPVRLRAGSHASLPTRLDRRIARPPHVAGTSQVAIRQDLRVPYRGVGRPHLPELGPPLGGSHLVEAVQGQRCPKKTGRAYEFPSCGRG